MSNTVALRLVQARKALNLTQEEFGSQSGLPLSTLKKYEGAHREPGAEALTMIGKVGVDLHWLLTGEGEPLVQARAKAEPTPAAEINVEALAAIIAAVDYANPKAHPSERAAVAAQAYATSIREGLITPTGPGQRAPKNAA